MNLSYRYRITALTGVAGLTIGNSLAQSTPETTPVAQNSPLMTIAEEMWSTIQRLYGGENGEFRPNYPSQPEDRNVAYLWPFSAVVSALGARARVRQDEASLADFLAALQTLEIYFDPESTPPGYSSFPPIYGGGDKFYDDNQWLGLDFLHAYALTNDEHWLEKSKLIWEFSMSGWDEIDHGGGIYWKEGDISTKNTCSNGPAAVHNMMLYEVTGDPTYLEWAIKIMEWLEATLYDDLSGVYWDNIDIGGQIDRTRYTYNTGTPMEACTRLYRATDDEVWLEKARALASASLKRFASVIDDNGVRTFPPTPWFNAVLQRGYNELFAVDPDGDRQFIEALPASLLRAWPQYLTADGLLPPDWSRQDASGQPLDLLEQAAVVEIASLGAMHLEP